MTPPRDFWRDLDGDNWPTISDDDPVVDWVVTVATWVFLLSVAGLAVRLLVQAVTA